METSGNVTADAYAGGVAAVPNYIENFFSIWLRTGTGASATVTTGLDASTNKALVWTKSRSAATDHKLTDTVRGATKALISDTTGAQTTDANGLTAFSSTGYTIGTDTNYNNSGATYVDWEFVATPKFFDVVTYTGDGTAGKTVSHNLGSVPGCIIVKRTDSTANWAVQHRSLTADGLLFLNSTAANNSGASGWNSTEPTSTQFTVGTNAATNASGATYVAYLFAHNAGGFGLTGTDNVISCGSFTGNGSTSGPSITLGYEPQWILTKNATSSGWNWNMFDNMRGLPVGSGDLALQANLSNAESGALNWIDPTATGFNITSSNAQINESGSTYIYIAIRRGPMKVPTDATNVFAPVAYTTYSSTAVTTGFPVDLLLDRLRGSSNTLDFDRLRGSSTSSSKYLQTNLTNAEATTSGTGFGFDSNTSVVDNYWNNNTSAIAWSFQRAPGFFDEVCYTGTGSARTVNHNLGVVPELMIVKRRDSTGFWAVYSAATGAANVLELQSSAAVTSGSAWNSTSPTASLFTVGNTIATGASGGTYVAYLFASCPGVSKVGSYTGNGSTQTINCGFTGGARFVLIKRTNTTGSWWVWDTARGMVAGTDPFLALDSTAAETNANVVYSVAGGFQLASSYAGTNGNGDTYVYLAIA